MPYDFTSNPPHVPEGDDTPPSRFALSDQVAELRATVAALTARAEQAEAELEKSVCVWCGHIGKRSDIAEHIYECIKSPLGELGMQWAAEKDALTVQLADAHQLYECLLAHRNSLADERDALRARLQVEADQGWETSWLHLSEAHHDLQRGVLDALEYAGIGKQDDRLPRLIREHAKTCRSMDDRSYWMYVEKKLNELAEETRAAVDALPHQERGEGEETK